MEKLTIQRVGQEKEVQTKFGPKNKTGVIFKEYPDLWHDTWLSGLKEGQVLEGTRESREYQGKTYWNFNLPKKENPNAKQFEEILGKLTVQNILLKEIAEWIRKQDAPPKSKVAGTDIDYPPMDETNNAGLEEEAF